MHTHTDKKSCRFSISENLVLFLQRPTYNSSLKPGCVTSTPVLMVGLSVCPPTDVPAPGCFLHLLLFSLRCHGSLCRGASPSHLKFSFVKIIFQIGDGQMDRKCKKGSSKFGIFKWNFQKLAIPPDNLWVIISLLSSCICVHRIWKRV